MLILTKYVANRRILDKVMFVFGIWLLVYRILWKVKGKH
jgi:hypothetical protein